MTRRATDQLAERGRGGECLLRCGLLFGIWLAGVFATNCVVEAQQGEVPAELKPAVGAATPEAGETASPEVIRALVRDLDSSSYSRREQATRRLQELGNAAYDELVAASDSPSRETRTRASMILRAAQFRTLVRAFEELGRQPNAKIDVEYGMWLIARILNPRVTRDSLQKPLDDLARRVRARLGPNVDVRKVAPQEALETLRLVIFEEQRFVGNERDYTNPENSSLEFVLAKRRGLPIMMSHVMIGVAERLDWPLVGVPLPGRYIVRYDGRRAPVGAPKDDLYFDAFTGRAKDLAELELQFGQVELDELSEQFNSRKILLRMLNNLENHLSLRGRSDQIDLAEACREALEREEEEDEDL